MGIELIEGDCLEKLKSIPDNYVDSIVTDPPYGYKFMGKQWDYDLPSVETWKECLRVLKPGGHLLSFGGTRTYHRLAVAIEDAGFEIRDQIQWLQGSGFPKNLDIRKQGIKAGLICDCKEISEHDLRPVRTANLSKTFDSSPEQREVLQSSVQEQSAPEFGAQGGSTVPRDESLLEGREVYRAEQGLRDDQNAGALQGKEKRLRAGAYIGRGENVGKAFKEWGSSASLESRQKRQSTGESEGLCKSQGALDGSSFPRCSRCEKKILQPGLGTALKPSNEPICLARKPLSEKTIAKNVLKHGTGGLNIDASRVGLSDYDINEYIPKRCGWKDGLNYKQKTNEANMFGSGKKGKDMQVIKPEGRFPANTILSHSEDCTEDQCSLFCAIAMLDKQSGVLKSGGKSGNTYRQKEMGIYTPGEAQDSDFYGSKGGASRFFMVVKDSCGQEKTRVGDTFAGKKTASSADNLNTDGYGSSTMDQYLLSTISITKTTTGSIMTFQILSASTKTCIGLCTVVSEKTIDLSKESNIESVSIVSNTEALVHLTNGDEQHIKGIVSLALLRSSDNGEKKIENVTTLTTENTGKGIRFFYIPKASKKDRGQDNTHPTCKPTKLMEYLIKLITPPNGTVLDPFMGSGSTGVAAKRLGFGFIGIEREQEYLEISEKRINSKEEEEAI